MNDSNMTGETFTALLAPCLAGVRKMVQSRLRGWDHAEDVLQQTLLQAFKHRNQLQSPAKFKTWLWSIAINEVYMFHRRIRRHVDVPLPDSPALEFRDRSPSQLEQLEQIERESRIQTALLALCDRDRMTIRLRDLEGFSTRETAKRLHKSEFATKSVHFRARQRLKLALEQESRQKEKYLVPA